MTHSSPSLRQRVALPPFPTGWFALCFAHELRPGATKTEVWLGRLLVLARSDDGELTLRSADSETSWTVIEQQGAIFTWFDLAGRPPLWRLPELDHDSWTTYAGHCWYDLATHPQETAENSVDVAHFGLVHGYSDVETLEKATVDGPVLRARYAFTRQALPFGFTASPIRATFTARVFGLGYSIVESHVEAYGLWTRQLVLSTPRDGERMDLRISGSVRHPGLPRPLADVASVAIRWGMIRGFISDVSDDLEIWQTKRYLARPRVVSGDGPIGRYRAWCRQFYPAEAA